MKNNDLIEMIDRIDYLVNLEIESFNTNNLEILELLNQLKDKLIIRNNLK